MGYVESNLMSEERIVYKAQIHWFIFVPGALLFAVGIFLFTVDTEGGAGPVFGLLAILFAIFSLLKALIQKVTTELAVTSKRASVARMRCNGIRDTFGYPPDSASLHPGYRY